jgi:hypothetical protein
MSGKNHNKRRNSLLVYEFLVRTISRALVEGDKKKSSAALKILKKYYKPGTNLYREFRLVNALAKTTVSSEHVAASILKEARSAAMSIDARELDREKSLLIKSINHTLNDDNFYDQQVSEYRSYATLQQLVNEWRETHKDLEKLASFEDQLMTMLTTPKIAEPDKTMTEESAGTARLLMKVMTKKLNEKYAGVLSDRQRNLVKTYALAAATDNKSIVENKLCEIRDALLPLLNEAISSESTGEFLKNKLVETQEVLMSEDLENIDDSTITRFMLYSKLQSELESKE